MKFDYGALYCTGKENTYGNGKTSRPKSQWQLEKKRDFI